MTMQTDVQAGAVAAGTPTAVTAFRSRIRGIIIGSPVGGGVLSITNGSSGASLFSYTAAGVLDNIIIMLPGEGILATTGIYVTPAASMTATVLYA